MCSLLGPEDYSDWLVLSGPHCIFTPQQGRWWPEEPDIVTGYPFLRVLLGHNVSVYDYDKSAYCFFPEVSAKLLP